MQNEQEKMRNWILKFSCRSDEYRRFDSPSRCKAIDKIRSVEYRKSEAIGDPIQIEDRDDGAHPMPKRCLTWGLASATRAGWGRPRPHAWRAPVSVWTQERLCYCTLLQLWVGTKNLAMEENPRKRAVRSIGPFRHDITYIAIDADG